MTRTELPDVSLPGNRAWGMLSDPMGGVAPLFGPQQGSMDNHQDEHLVCADCGTSFVFSAGEAAVFQERGLSSPKRCKDCRRARKDRGGADSGRPPRSGHSGGWGGAQPEAGPPRGSRGRRMSRGSAPPQGPPRYTGDVNEYRSPMQDHSFVSAWQASPNVGFARPPSQGPVAPRPRRVQGYRDGEYRSPSGNAYGHGGGQGHRPRTHAEAQHGGGPSSGRRRPSAEMFSITCNACGSPSEVPFKPAEGREVFCPSCYRARKPA